jgi:hypothetical protein
MKMVKSLILGSAAGIVAMSGAQAADLPVKAKAVEYVKICSLYGAGFFYIPGTDTCIKLGGYLRVDTTFNGGVYDAPLWSGDGGMQGSRFADRINSRSRMALTVDTRTATEYGVVRTFGQGDFQFSTFGGTVNNAALNAAALTGGLNNDTPGNGYVAVENAFIQFAGFTFGKSASAYATPWNGYPGNNTSFLLGGPDYVTGVNNIQYTAQFGNGVSGTIGLDEGKVFNRTSLGNLDVATPGANYPTSSATPANALSLLQGGYGLGAAAGSVISRATGTPANGYGGQVAPDLAGNIRVDQAWGVFQISGVAHLVNASYNQLDTSTGAGAQGFSSPYPSSYNNSPAFTGVPGTSSSSVTSGHPDSKVGGAITAALQLKNIPTGAGDDIKIDGTYAKGDTKAVISTSGASPSFAMFNHIGSGDPTVGFGYVSDGVFSRGLVNAASSTGGAIQLTEAYGIRGAFNHNWDPYWSTSIFGSYSAVRYNALAQTAYCNSVSANGLTGWGNRVGSGGSSVCNPDFNIFMIGTVTRWTPVKNLTFSAEVMYVGLDQKWSGTTASLWSAPAPLQQTTYTFHDQSTVSVNVRAQRNF